MSLSKKNYFGADSKGVSTTSIYSSSSSSEKAKKCCRIDVLVIVVVLLVIWGLLSLPVVFFYIPTGSTNINSANQTPVSPSNTACPSVILYSGSMCRNALLQPYSGCESPPPQDILVTIDALDQAGQLLGGLQLIASQQCIEVATPFLCLHLFGGVCDENGLKYLPTASDCTEISTGACQVEWELGRSTGFPLPNCSLFPSVKQSLSCPNKSRDKLIGSGEHEDNENSLLIPLASSCPMMCRQYFFCDDSTANLCVPRCPEWNLYPLTTSRALDKIILSCAIVGLISGILVIIVSVIRYKKVYTFPSVLVIYITIDQLILIFAHVITFIKRQDLYCTSPNLILSLLNSTPFCIMTGILVHYIFTQLNIWWVTHTATLLWKVSYPLKVKTFHARNRHKIIHLACVLIGFSAPMISVIAIIADDHVQGRNSPENRPGNLGFGFGIFPPVLCAGLNGNVTFYTLILPNILLVMVGTSMLALTIWVIHKKQGILQSLTAKSSFVVSTAEKKLLLVISYYIFLQVLTFAHFSITKQAGANLEREITKYFQCEQSGYDPARPCSRSGFENLINPGVAVMSFIFALLTPTVNFVFVIDYRQLKEKLLSLCYNTKQDIHI